MSETKPYQICVCCVMDTTDPEITFDESGVCSHCRRFDAQYRMALEWSRTPQAIDALKNKIDAIKKSGKGRSYDCIIGISGGVDSTYLAYKVKGWGLRPLAVHYDSGWNSELAVSNIENLVKKLDINLFTVVADWEEMRDLQLAFFKASLANCDIPQDHAFLATLYKIAGRHGIKYFLSGGNLATESILPAAWGYNAADLRHLRGVYKRFGTKRLRAYPTLNFFERYFYYPFIRQIKEVRPLNMIPYDKREAKKEISEKLGWRDYGGKHYESIFTRYFQSSYLPQKFGFDKRKAHYSSLILSGQMRREEALEELKEAPIDSIQGQRDKQFVAKKLGCSQDEFEEILSRCPRSYKEYPSNDWFFSFKKRLTAMVGFKRVA